MSTDYQEQARELAGNWKQSDSFVWHDEPDDADLWAIVYFGAGRDADALGESNHASVLAMLKETDPDGNHWREESHNHWAVGYVDGFAVRMTYPTDSNFAGDVTPAGRAIIDTINALEDYPVLDDEDFSRRGMGGRVRVIQIYVRPARLRMGGQPPR